MILLKLRDLRIIATQGFEGRYRHEEERVRRLAEKARETSGGTFWNVQPMRIGERFGKAVLSDVTGGQTSYTEAFRLLGLRNVKQLNTLGKHLEQVTVYYHCEEGLWWAESPSLPGFSSAADSLRELRELTKTGIDFALDGVPHLVLEVSAL